MTTIRLTADHAARVIGFSIDAIDASANVARPVYLAGQRAGRHCKPILQEALDHIDWHEVARTVVLGLAITAIATWQILRWSLPAIIRFSERMGRWYSSWFVDHPAPADDPQPAQPCIDEPQPQAAAPEPAATVAIEPTTSTIRPPRRQRRRRTRQAT